eukprot:scaffold4633_cov114-Isochrysis_galbana.AAC.4
MSRCRVSGSPSLPSSPRNLRRDGSMAAQSTAAGSKLKTDGPGVDQSVHVVSACPRAVSSVTRQDSASVLHRPSICDLRSGVWLQLSNNQLRVHGEHSATLTTFATPPAATPQAELAPTPRQRGVRSRQWHARTAARAAHTEGLDALYAIVQSTLHMHIYIIHYKMVCGLRVAWARARAHGTI